MRAIHDVVLRATFAITNYNCLYAAVAELADARDLKSLDSNIVPVQVRSAAPYLKLSCYESWYNLIVNFDTVDKSIGFITFSYTSGSLYFDSYS